MKKVISIFIAALIIISSIPVFSFAGDSVTANGIVEISKYGNVKINLPHAVLYEHFELGDIVTVSFGDVTLDVPVCVSFSDVDSGNAGLFCQTSGETEETELAINTGNFAEAYGIAKKTVFQDKTYKWEYQNGFSQATVFTVKMKEKAGYLEEFTVRNLVFTNDRANYSELSDAQFANFRMVTAGNIAEGVLYRSSSPVDTAINRNVYADNMCREYGITRIINLGDSEEKLNMYAGYAESYYHTVNHIAVEASMNPAADENKAKFAECFRYIIANPDGKFLVHCREGKERTGMFIAIIECLMGASYDEVAADYMVSYSNYYALTEGDKAYSVIVNGNIRKTLEGVFGVAPEGADLVKEAEEYLSDIGLSNGEITSLKSVLSGESEFSVVIRSFFENILKTLLSIFERLKNLFLIVF